MTRPRIGFVSQWFLPEPVLVPRWIVESLARRGVTVEVLTAVPNYPSGRTAAGYHAWRPQTERLDGVVVRRTPVFPYHGRRALGRVANYVTWAFSASILGSRSLGDVDVVLVYSSPATAAMPAMVARRLWRTPYVLLIQDVWPDSVVASNMVGRRAGSVSRVLDVFVRVSYRWAEHIIVTSPGMKTLLASRGVPADKISLVYNWIGDDTEPGVSVRSNERERMGLQPDDFVLMYAGNLGSAQDLDCLIEAVGMLPPASRCRLLLIGDGIDKGRLMGLAQRVAPDRVTFVGPVPRERMSSLMAAADVQVVSLADRPLFRVTTPSKVQSVMAAGQPILASATGDVADVIASSGAGIGVPAGRPAELATAMERLSRTSAADLCEMGRRGRTYYQTSMQESVGAPRLLQCLLAAATSHDKVSSTLSEKGRK